MNKYNNRIIAPYYPINIDDTNKHKIQTIYNNNNIQIPLEYKTYEYFINGLKTKTKIFDNSLNSKIALKGLYKGQELRRMYNDKNNLIRNKNKIAKKYFNETLKYNDTKDWWDEQIDYKYENHSILKKL